MHLSAGLAGDTLVKECNPLIEDFWFDAHTKFLNNRVPNDLVSKLASRASDGKSSFFYIDSKRYPAPDLLTYGGIRF